MQAYDNHQIPKTQWYDQSVLLAEKWAVFTSGIKITIELKDLVIHQYHKDAMEISIQSMHYFSDFNMECMNWEGMK